MDDYNALYRRNVELEVEARQQRAEIERLQRAIIQLVGVLKESLHMQRTTFQLLANPRTPQCDQQIHEAVGLETDFYERGVETVRVITNQICGEIADESGHMPMIQQATEHHQVLSNTQSPVGTGQQRSESRHEPSVSSGASDQAETSSARGDGDQIQQFQGNLIDLGNDDCSAIQTTCPVPQISVPLALSVPDTDPAPQILHTASITTAEPEALTVTLPPFSDHERSRVIGYATWIEDWTADETDEGWKKFAKANSSHPADEWKRYYNTVVRPQLVEKGQIKDEKASEVDPSGGNIGTEHTSGLQANSINLGEAIRKQWGNRQLITCIETNENKNTLTSRTAESEVTSEAEGSMIALPPSGVLPNAGDDQDSRSGLIVSTEPEKTQISDYGGEKLDPYAQLDLFESTIVNNNEMQVSKGEDGASPAKIDAGLDQHEPPNSETNDKSLQHTVMIHNIKPGSAMLKILDHVRGGRVISATYIKTSKHLRHVKTDAVMVVFAVPAQAQAYVDFCTKNALGIKATMIESPTFSCAAKKDRVFKKDPDLSMTSRVLYLDIPNQSMTPKQVLSKLRKQNSKSEKPFKRFLKMKPNEDGRMFIQFATIVDAKAAKAVANESGSTLEEFNKGFATDPCEGPLHGLLRSSAF
nr:hypothetical protein CFP56_25821 [Quercus suber]